MEKKTARAEIRRRLARLTLRDRAEKSERAAALLAALDEFRSAKTVLLFASLPDEIDTMPILRQVLREDKRVVLPRCVMATRELLLCPVRDVDRDLAPSAYGIREPTADAPLDLGEIDFALIPARACDEHGHRLGRGAGFYDRLLSRSTFRAVRCAFVFEEQILHTVPHDQYDEPIDLIVTDQAVRRVRRESRGELR